MGHSLKMALLLSSPYLFHWISPNLQIIHGEIPESSNSWILQCFFPNYTLSSTKIQFFAVFHDIERCFSMFFLWFFQHFPHPRSASWRCRRMRRASPRPSSTTSTSASPRRSPRGCRSGCSASAASVAGWNTREIIVRSWGFFHVPNHHHLIHDTVMIDTSLFGHLRLGT